MNPLRRRAVAHLAVDDVEVPELDDARAHHLSRVLRVRDGELVTVTDGRGRWRVCRMSAGGVVPDGPVIEEPEPETPLTVYTAIPKQDRPEWLVHKATEVGVDRLVFVHAERSVVRWTDERASRHLSRLERIATEALMQSRRVWAMSLGGPVDSMGILSQAVVAEPGGRPLRITDRAIAIGPEGGWTERERAAAIDEVSLSSQVLRVETAVLVAAAIAGAYHPT